MQMENNKIQIIEISSKESSASISKEELEFANGTTQNYSLPIGVKNSSKVITYHDFVAKYIKEQVPKSIWNQSKSYKLPLVNFKVR